MNFAQSSQLLKSIFSSKFSVDCPRIWSKQRGEREEEKAKEERGGEGAREKKMTKGERETNEEKKR